MPVFLGIYGSLRQLFSNIGIYYVLSYSYEDFWQTPIQAY